MHSTGVDPEEFVDSRDGEAHPLEARMQGAKQLLEQTREQKGEWQAIVLSLYCAARWRSMHFLFMFAKSSLAGETVWAALDVFSKRREMYAVLTAPEEEGGMLGGLT
eukprot:SAG31_NODE_3845_length_3820_cov_14.896657_3_plen_106_part_01